MKLLSVIGLMLLIAACSSYEVRCKGGLQPVNAPAAAAPVAAPKHPASPAGGRP